MIDPDARRTVARLRHLRTSPTKVRPVLRLIAGQDIATARDTLRLSDRAASNEVAKVLDSAVANAEHNDNIPEDELFVAQAFADEGPALKRWRPRARGRGTRIHKRTTHLTIVVARLEEDRLEERRRIEAGGRGPRRVGRRRARAEGATAAGESPDAATDADEVDEAAPEKTTAKKTAKKSTKATKKATKKAAPEKTTAKKTAKKSTKATKKTTKKSTKKTTAKKPGAAKKAAKEAGER